MPFNVISMNMLRNLIAWWCVFSYLLMLPIGATGSLLCIGEDGHVAIEYSLNGDCSGSFSHEQQSNNGISGTHCGACIDLPLSEPAQISNSKNSSSSDHEYSKTVKLIVHNLWALVIQSQEASSPPRYYALLLPSNDLLSLQTTVLLI